MTSGTCYSRSTNGEELDIAINLAGQYSYAWECQKRGLDSSSVRLILLKNNIWYYHPTDALPAFQQLYFFWHKFV